MLDPMERVTVKQAAGELNIDQLTLRYQMEKEKQALMSVLSRQAS